MTTAAWLGAGLGTAALVLCAFLGRLLREAKPHHHREHEDQAQRDWVRQQALERIRSKQPDVIDLTDETRVEQDRGSV